MVKIEILRIRSKGIDKSTGERKRFTGIEKNMEIFGIGMLPDGRRIAFESEKIVRAGERHEARKVIGQNKYRIK
ncbi:hypothetical protein KY340_00365 [Candidatus Woesearchaeota archaeon]|nr:hypothetical protein [Candidatus Woesearchaeota archaeon]